MNNIVTITERGKNLTGVLKKIVKVGESRHLEMDVHQHNIEATRLITTDKKNAKKLKHHINKEIKIYGKSVWRRELDKPKNNWELVSFFVYEWEPYQYSTTKQFDEDLENIRVIHKKTEWGQMDDPLDTLEKMRRGD